MHKKPLWGWGGGGGGYNPRPEVHLKGLITRSVPLLITVSGIASPEVGSDDSLTCEVMIVSR